MQKRACFRLLAASAALVLMISVCCVTVFGYEPDTAVNTYTTGTVTKDEENPPVEPTPTPSESSSGSSASSSSESSTSSESSNSSESSTPSESSASSESSNSSEPDDNSGGDTDSNTGGNTNGNTNGNTGGNTGGDADENTSSSSSNSTAKPLPTPDSDPIWSGTTSQTQDPQNSSPDFGDDDNTDLVDDGSVISSLPIPGETEESGESSGDSSEESSSTAAAAGNSGSPLLFFGGIALIVLGVAGLGTVVYLQFIRPALAAKKAGSKELFVSEDDDGYTVSQTPADPMSDTAEINLPDDGDDK